jgi:hypothetical protein
MSRSKLSVKPKTLIGVGMSKPTGHMDHDHVDNVARPCMPRARQIDPLTESAHVFSTIDRIDEGGSGSSYGD